MKLTIHLPSSDEAATRECFNLPELALLTASKRALFVFRKGIERLRDEKRLAPDPQRALFKTSSHPLAGKRMKRKARK